MAVAREVDATGDPRSMSMSRAVTRQTRRAAAALLALAAGLAGGVASAGEIRTFGDWSVACDNALACTAIGLGPRGAGGSPFLRLTRTAGPNPVTTVTIAGVDALSGRTLRADGRPVVFPALTGDDDRVADDAALRGLIDGLAGARRLTWFEPPTEEDSVSLAGMNEALRLLDERQGRTGTPLALVARGPSDKAAPAPAYPVLSAPAVPEPDEVTGGSAAREVAAFHRRNLKRFDCDRDIAAEGPPSTGHRLDGTRVLYETTCARAVYQASTMLYVHDRAAPAGRRVSPAPIERLDDLGRVASAGPARALLEVDYGGGVLTSHGKGRGVGDCYEHSSWTWDGRVFRLTHASVAPHCGYSGARYVLWRAGVKRPNGEIVGLDPLKDADLVD